MSYPINVPFVSNIWILLDNGENTMPGDEITSEWWW